MNPGTASITPLPEPIARYIDRFVGRRRVIRLLRAVARAALATIVWTLVWCVVDRLLALTPAARAMLLAANVAIVLVMLARPLLAMLRRADVNVAAAEIERRQPRLAQRLRTITSRLGDDQAYGSSSELLDALARQVVDDVRGDDPTKLLSWRPVVRPAAMCAFWVALAWTLGFSSWLDQPTRLRRYVAPFAAIGPVTTTRLNVTPGDAAVTQGDPLRVQASAVRLADGRSPALHVRAPAAPSWHVEPMTATPDGKFEAQIARVDRDLEYFVTGGDARTAAYRVTMLPRPAVRHFRVRYAYPPHTGLAPRDVTNDTGVIEAPVGTEVTLGVETTEPLSYAVMTAGAESIRIAPTSATQPARAQTTLTVTEDRRYTLRMVSDRGVSGVFRGGSIRAIVDRAPVVQFRGNAAASREVASGDVVPVGYQAVDDYGLARLDLEVRVIRKSGAEANTALAIPLTRGQRARQGVFPVELRRFGLEVGDTVELRLQAEDRAGQFARSAPARLVVTTPTPTATPQAAPPQPVASASPPSTAADSSSAPPPPPPHDPAGYEAAIRAYFDTLRSAAPAPATQP